MPSKVDIRPDHAQIVQNILKEFVPERTCWVFGSRAKWIAKEYSDLDVCILGDTPLTFTTLGLLNEAFCESDLPYKVDIVDWATISPDFKKIIEHDKVIFQQGQDKNMSNILKEGWREVRLEKIIEFKNGKSSPERQENGKFYIFGSNGVIGKTELFNAKEYTIIVGRVGSFCGSVYLSKDKCWVTDNAIIGVTKEKNDTNFMYHVLNSRKLNSLRTGSGQPLINQSILNSISVKIPPLKTQQKIAKVLGDLDDKIELNNQMNQTLDGMAQALFKSWFVDFDPVRAKADVLQSGGTPEQANLSAMAVISGKSAQELEELSSENPDDYKALHHTATLFPSSFTDSALGLIPEGWTISDIGSEFDVTMGQSPPSETYNEIGEGKVFFQGRRDFGWRFPSERVFCSQPQRMAKKGDTLLSVRAPVGDINQALTDCCIGRGVASLIHKSGCKSYTYYVLLNLKEKFSSFDAEGTVFGSINQKDLKSINIISSDNKILKIFSNIISKKDSLIEKNHREIITLTQIRDGLLPKLLSGEIEVL